MLNPSSYISMNQASAASAGRTIWITPGAGRIPSTPRQREDMISSEAGNQFTFWAIYMISYVVLHMCGGSCMETALALLPEATSKQASQTYLILCVNVLWVFDRTHRGIGIDKHEQHVA